MTELKGVFKQLKIEEIFFNRNGLLRFLYSSFAAQFVSILVSPVNSRLYSPFDYGLYGIFMSAVSIGTILFSFRSEIIVNKLSVSIYRQLDILLFFIILYVPIQLLIFLFWYLFNFEIIFLLLPLAILLTAIYTIQLFHNIVKRKLIRVDIAKFSLVALSSLLNIIAGLFFPDAISLVICYIISCLIAISVLTDLDILRIIKKKYGNLNFNFSFIGYLFFRRKSEIWFLTIGDLINNTSKELPSILISSFFGLNQNGFFLFANKTAGSPSKIVADNFVQYSFGAISGKSKNEIIKYINRNSSKLILLSFLAYLPFLIWGKELIMFVFGEQWENAAIYAIILIPAFIFNMVGNSINMVFNILNKSNYALYYSIAGVLFVFCAFFAGYLIQDIYLALVFYSAFITLRVIVAYLFILKLNYE